MQHFLNDIVIDNFKSIKHCKLHGCKRINLFIGKPNVGKSNILEALSLFSLPFLQENSSKKISSFIRAENEAELFYNGNVERPVRITINKDICELLYDKYGGEGVRLNMGEVDEEDSMFSWSFVIDSKLNFRHGGHKKPYIPFVKKYTFSTNVTFKKGHSRYLIPPYGYNMLNVLEANTHLKEEFSNLFKEYGLELVFDKGSQSLKIMRESKNDIFLIPYNSIADTLQRIIFFKTAIASNEDSVLIFEEPEAHAFPPYISKITQEIIHKKNNQYFIATHSPFILNDFLENDREELSVFIVDYKNHQTTVKRLSDKELHEIYQYGVDLFTNNESFLAYGSEHPS